MVDGRVLLELNFMGWEGGSDCELAWTGERLVTNVQGDVALEHLHRYALAMELARDRAVLDVACGEGYGSNLLARVARHVIGVDIDPKSVCCATRKYSRNNLSFRTGNGINLPVESSSVDLVVSFETLEHLAEHDHMLEEIKRVLVPGGTLIMSTPDRRNYSDIPGYTNPFHVKELYVDEFGELISRHFSSYVMMGQRLCEGSLLVPIDEGGTDSGKFGSFWGNFEDIHGEVGLRSPIYLVAIATDGAELPHRAPSLFEGAGLRSNKDQQLAERDLRLQENECTIARLDREVAEVHRTAADRDGEKDRQLEQRSRELAHTIGERDRAEMALVEAHRALAEQGRWLAHKDEQLARAEAALAGAIGSRSWRITAPLRATGKLARGARSRAQRAGRVAIHTARKGLRAMPFARRVKRSIPVLITRWKAWNGGHAPRYDEAVHTALLTRQDPAHLEHPVPYDPESSPRRQSGHISRSE